MQLGLVPVVCRQLDCDLSAADVLRLMQADPHPAALLGAWAGGSDIVAAAPVRVCEELDSADPGDLTERAGRLASAAAGSAFSGSARPAAGCRCRRRPASLAACRPAGPAITITCSGATGPPAGGRSRCW
jgi:hypothetical protein